MDTLLSLKASDSIAIIAALIAIGSAVITYLGLLETKRIAQYQLNAEILYDIEKALKDDLDLLHLHGIDTKLLEEHDISKEEFWYILSSFRAGAAYYIIDNRSDKKLTHYRISLLNNSKVELVYKTILRNLLIAEGPLIELVDDYYRRKNNS